MKFVSYIRRDAGHILRNPSKLLKLRHKSTRQRVVNLMKSRFFQSSVSDEWDNNDSFQQRRYSDYEQYLEHQKLKVGFLNLSDYDVRFRESLAQRLKEMDIVEPGSRVVCLAARIGSEVKAFKDNGCFAVGIDLNPGEDNQHVLHGDFHELQFADSSVDMVYTNSLDHAFDIEKIVNEVKRVLRPAGVFLVEAIAGTDEGISPHDFESFFWESTDDLVSLFQSLGLELIEQVPFEHPWKGCQLQLRNPEVAAQMSSRNTEHASR